ncbi:10644_t:CDS:2 [Funneliformis geosporum]|uniref:10644_t:CDS:1 n=1 Tax=Funneliformis geosporum TaxID=1117311 RepID=A0A9W4T913_9GLOM|nr:10644_t:CDS:2 [Funneliformis geosporum]
MESLSQVMPEGLAKKVEKALLEVLEMLCKKLQLVENPDGYARYIARKLVPDEISYNTRIEKEEKCEISKENAKGIIQGLLNMSLTDD